jgi:hypothetical protein
LGRVPGAKTVQGGQTSHPSFGNVPKTNQTCLLTPMHIPGHQNAIADVPSRSFGCHPAWHCATDSDVLTLFNSMFPLPNQQSWTVFHLNYKVAMHVISALWMQPFKLDGWRRHPKVGKHVSKIGAPTPGLWEWIHTCNTPLSKPVSDASRVAARTRTGFYGRG